MAAPFIGKTKIVGEEYENEKVVIQAPTMEIGTDDIIDVSKLLQLPFDNVPSQKAVMNLLATMFKLYLMRMQPSLLEAVTKAVEKSRPADLNPENTLGLPIRASDKCFAESDCLSFAQYMDLVAAFMEREKEEGNEIKNIILTSESKAMIDARLEYDGKIGGATFFINSDDSMQGSGRPRHYKNEVLVQEGISPNQIMASTLTALNLQLYSKITIANCCSNFHKFMMQVRQYAGCGSELPFSPSDWICLNDLSGPLERYKICCFGSKKNNECENKGEHEVGSDYLRPPSG